MNAISKLDKLKIKLDLENNGFTIIKDFWDLKNWIE